ncbi:MAG: undecaprenyldiphospho-muramoylpentapeptide beta-N-acetylglucosaminyltransferase [Clostridia bacterium]|nr:undecaprenyldiphospho-muramoylpentapeptide beta-N-acetylglucosaminyltransferase [Clostridia bacterium]
MRIIITGGGTGGHIYPALSIANGLINKFNQSEILYVGSEQGLEKDFAIREGFAFKGVAVAGLPRPLSFKTVGVLFKNFQGLAQSSKVIAKFKPDLVVGSGGYACGPIMLAAALKGVPTLLHEQNAVMGLTNRILSRFVDVVCLTFPVNNLPDTKKYKYVLTGLPVRQNIMKSSRAKGVAALGLKHDCKTILITGGSQGAKHLNETVASLWRELIARNIQIIHIAGPKLFVAMQEEAVKQGLGAADGLYIYDYLHNMSDALWAADVIIGRAGASFLAEVAAVGRASVLVPYPYAAGNHQEANAKALADVGGATMILDKDLTAANLKEAVLAVLEDAALQRSMENSALMQGHSDALQNIIQEALKITEK